MLVLVQAVEVGWYEEYRAVLPHRWYEEYRAVLLVGWYEEYRGVLLIHVWCS